MKNHRKLAPGEAICQRDRFLREGLLIPYHPEWFGKPHDPARETVEAYRLARTEGCPPGWRWADAGEKTKRRLVWSGSGIRTSGKSKTVLEDAGPTTGWGGYVMPWPEDERLVRCKNCNNTGRGGYVSEDGTIIQCNVCGRTA